MSDEFLLSIDNGCIVCDSGNMFGGKTTSLIRRVRRLQRIDANKRRRSKELNQEFEPLTFGVFKPLIDNRYSDEEIVTHDGISIPAKAVKNIEELKNEVDKYNYKVIVIDEVQFFDSLDENGKYKVVNILSEFANRGKVVLVAGLEKDFKGEPFGPMGQILSVSDFKQSHFSLCSICGSPATLPQRLVNGEPAHYDDPIILVGTSEDYEPRCRKHHIVKKEPRENSCTDIKKAI